MNPDQNNYLQTNNIPPENPSATVAIKLNKPVVIVSLVYLILIAVLFFQYSNYSSKEIPKSSEQYIKYAINPRTYIQVSILDTPISTDSAQIKAVVRGLLRTQKGWDIGDRVNLDDNEGLLALSQKRHYHTYVPSDMPIHVDIIWIDRKKVVDLDQNIQRPFFNQSHESIQRYAPKILIDKFLLVKNGFIKNHNIEIGDQVEFVGSL